MKTVGPLAVTVAMGMTSSPVTRTTTASTMAFGFTGGGAGLEKARSSMRSMLRLRMVSQVAETREAVSDSGYETSRQLPSPIPAADLIGMPFSR